MKFTFDTSKLKAQAEDNPVLAIGAAAALLTGVSKLLDSNTKRQNAKTWRKEVARRDRKK